MPNKCTICRKPGCRADRCQSTIIDDSYRALLETFDRIVCRDYDSVLGWPPYQVSMFNDEFTTSDIPVYLNPPVIDGESIEWKRGRIVCSRGAYIENGVYAVCEIMREHLIGITLGLYKRIVPRFIARNRLNYHHLGQFVNSFQQSDCANFTHPGEYISYLTRMVETYVRELFPVTQFLNLTRFSYDEIMQTGLTTPDTNHIMVKMDGSDTCYLVDDHCPVCMEDMVSNNTVALNCGHSFCGDCSVEFIKRCTTNCAMCREQIREVRFKSDILPDKFNAIMQLCLQK
mgnify:CR=1 FL=1|jgi:hypothetical protein